MKKVFFVLLFALFSVNAYAGIISVDAFISPDSVTIPHLETFRSTVLDLVNGNLDSNNIKADSIQETNMADAINPRVRWDEAFNDFVYSGLTIPTSDSLVSTIASGVAYVGGYRVAKDATSNTFTASKWTYVDLNNLGTYVYQNTSIGATEPSITANSIRIALVSSDTSKINYVRDDRVLSIATSTNEDHFRSGLEVSATPLATITVSPGAIKHGTTFLKKTTATTLNIGTASDWAGGVSGRATSSYGYVGISATNTIKLIAAAYAPTKADVSGNTEGTLRYSVVDTVYYRIIGWFFMNADGSGNVFAHSCSNFKDGDVYNTIVTYDTVSVSVVNTTYGTNFNNTKTAFYSTGRPISISAQAKYSGDAGRQLTLIADIDGTNKAGSEMTGYSGSGGVYAHSNVQWQEKLSQGAHNITIQAKTDGGTSTITPWNLIIEEK